MRMLGGSIGTAILKTELSQNMFWGVPLGVHGDKGQTRVMWRQLTFTAPFFKPPQSIILGHSAIAPGTALPAPNRPF